MKGLKASLKYVNKCLFAGDEVNEDCLLLKARIMQIKEREYFFAESSDELDWVLQEGKMHPGFLYLEDEKPAQFLESLMINGKDEVDINPILSEIFTFYSNLYE